MSFEGISHDDAVGFLKDATGTLHFHLMREIIPVKVEEEATPAKGGESPSSMVVKTDDDVGAAAKEKHEVSVQK